MQCARYAYATMACATPRSPQAGPHRYEKINGVGTDLHDHLGWPRLALQAQYAALCAVSSTLGKGKFMSESMSVPPRENPRGVKDLADACGQAGL
jgi:hypothetical protein